MGRQARSAPTDLGGGSILDGELPRLARAMVNGGLRCAGELTPRQESCRTATGGGMQNALTRPWLLAAYPAGVNRIDAKLAPIESSLSWLGMPGVTAYFGLLELGRPRPGDTVVVSAASGAVGQLVGQIAKLAGARAVAIAGRDDKLGWCREIGFEATINYKKAADITAAVKEACPRGVDIFFDNT